MKKYVSIIVIGFLEDGLMDKKKELKKQAIFCKELMDRLLKSVEENIDKPASYWSFSGINNCNQMSNDIVRLRRELNALNKMLSPDSNR